jgi:hypothetical protein
MRPQPALLALTVAVEVQVNGPAGLAQLVDIATTASTAVAIHATHRLISRASIPTAPCKFIGVAPYSSIRSIEVVAPLALVFCRYTINHNP